MHRDIFYSLGKLIYILRWWIVLFSIIGVISCLPIIPKVLNAFTATGFVDPNSQSAQADEFLKNELAYRRNQFIIMYQGDKSFQSDPQFSSAIKKSLANLKNFPIKNEIIYPDDNKNLIAKDKHTVYAVVILKGDKLLSEADLNKFKAAVKSPAHYKMTIGGEPFFLHDTNKQTQKDLIKAEYIATPIAVITLLIVFGSLIAALIPILIDLICAVIILSILALVGAEVSLSVFTLNIALLLGLCLSLDYALFIVSRFREELAKGSSTKEAVAITQATAGKAVFFSGLAILASLSALLLFPINILFSVGIGGMTAVAAAVSVCFFMLPALLGIINHKINFLPIKLFSKENHKAVWMAIVSKVVKYPWTCFIGILAFLIFLGLPFLHVNIGISDYKILPQQVQSRQAFDIFKEKFSEEELSPIFVVIKSPDKNILSKKNIGAIYDFVKKLKDDSRVLRVDSIVSGNTKLNKGQYQELYAHKEHLPATGKQLLKLTTKNGFTVLTVVSKYPNNAEQTINLIKKIRSLPIKQDLSIQVTGVAANTIDVLHTISNIFPYAFLWVIILSYIILLFLLRSLFLPLKAILTNMLSLFASYGVLVSIIQLGYFANLLNVEPQGMIDISLLIIIFCALFGFSTDYEVFLLSRIKEYFEMTKDNVRSICFGITQSSKIITSAAIVVILICFSFITADVLLVKAFGLGIAIAIFVDAFLIRTILVPATMALMRKWNWYLPRWLNRLLPKFFFAVKGH